MRSAPTTDDERREAEELGAQPWMLDVLACNPSYVSWGPHEDYMMVKSAQETDFDAKHHLDGGWASRVLLKTWSAFQPDWSLNELNECVNFYFTIVRDSEPCSICGGDGMHPDAKWVNDSWYEHSSPFADETASQRDIKNLLGSFSLETPSQEPLRSESFPSEELIARYGAQFRQFAEEMRIHKYWCNRITQDEVDTLLARGRLPERTRAGRPWTAAEVNGAGTGNGYDHDAINRWICVSRRLQRLGMPEACEDCRGSGHIYTEPEAHLSLVLWWLHPRKGSSRGIEIDRIEESEVPLAREFLREAARRNAERFSRV